MAVALVFGQTAEFEFLWWDDSGFVFDNPHIAPGLTLAGLKYAFTDGPYGEWTPTTTLSHMLDCQLYGASKPGWHHLTSVLLHAVSALLLFLALLRMTGQRAVPEVAQASGVRVAPAGPSATTGQRAVPEVAQAVPASGARSGTSERREGRASGPERDNTARVAPAGPSATTLWPSAWVAAVFAVHPLHVSTVAWVAERREVLAGLFFTLALFAYARYVERPSLARYVPIFICLALGLMAKAILVTFPFVLLLLDYWPLGRFRRVAGAGRLAESDSWLGRLPVGWRLIVEKIPLMCLSAADCAIVMSTHASFHMADLVEERSLASRVINALTAYAAYLGQTFCPVDLSPYYPHPGEHLPIGPAIGALVLLVAISVIAGFFWRRLPYLLVGWLWFLGMLVPALGLVGAFLHARADNYTYLSRDRFIDRAGLGRAGCVSLTGQSLHPADWRRWLLTGVSGAAILLLAVLAWFQTTYWAQRR